jgi:transposase
MKKIQRSPAFKKKVVLEMFREEKTLAQVASEHEVHPTLITKWKREVIESMEGVFAKKNKIRQEEWQGRDALEKKIGQLTVEIDYLKKKLGY